MLHKQPKLKNWTKNLWLETTTAISNVGTERFGYSNADHVKEEAQELLDLTRLQAAKLFYVDEWPLEFRKQYYELEKRYRYLRTPAENKAIRKQMAQVTVNRIDKFIAQYER